MRLIDADALKEAVNTKRVVGRFNTIQLIDNAPTIKTFTLEDIEEEYRKGLEKGLSEWETERPHGEWLHPYVTDIACECSICHVQTPTYRFNFCPNCGADMRGIDR